MSREFEAMIFAAGQGVRLGDLGTALPNALLPVWKDAETLEPILARLLRQVAVAGPRVIRTVVHHQWEHIERFLGRVPLVRDRKVELVHQEVLDGEAGGLFLVPPSDLPILAIDVDNYLSDELFFKRLIDEHLAADCLATIGVCAVTDITRYANVKIAADGTLVDILEKPRHEEASGAMAKMGCYVLSPALLERGRQFFLNSRGEIATTAAFSNLCRLDEPVRCVCYQGEFLDIGDLVSYAKHLTREDVVL